MDERADTMADTDALVDTVAEAEDTSWGTLRRQLELRHDLGLRWDRRRAHPDPHDPAAVPLLLRQASTRVDDDVRRALEDVGPRLTPASADLLRRLRDRPSAGSELAAYLGTAPQRVSETVARLEHLGLLEREGSPNDLRADRILVTDAGHALAADVDGRLARLAEVWLEDFGLGARGVLLFLLASLAEGA